MKVQHIEDHQVKLRIERGLRDWLKHQAIDNRRSLNSEILARLDQSRAQEEARQASREQQ